MIIEENFEKYFDKIYGDVYDAESVKGELKELYFAGFRDCLEYLNCTVKNKSRLELLIDCKMLAAEIGLYADSVVYGEDKEEE